MTVDEFLSELTEALERDEPLALGQDLAESGEWDSLAVLSVVDLFEQISAEADLGAIGEATTTDDLVALAGGALEG
ncbi:MAG TPA: hypothetical protein VEW25_12080 [Allosphingosinicella sp.]|nr:hypothetical protein [Allosphingosinicella sp.]